MSYGLGWREDKNDRRDVSTSHAYPFLLSDDPAPSLRPYKQGYLYQNGYGACVGFALARALHMSLLIADERAGRPLSASMPSPGFIYQTGLRQELVEARALGLPDPPVVDKGSFPRLVMRGCQSVGYCREQEYNFSALAADIDGFPTNIRKPPPRAYVCAFDQRNLRYSRVFQTGSERKAEVQRLLRARVPVIFGMTVDSPFQANRGRIIEAIDASKVVGGHMLALLEAPEEGPIFDNWWGDGWGDGGEGQMTWALFGSPLIRDVYAVEAAPAFSSEAP